MRAQHAAGGAKRWAAPVSVIEVILQVDIEELEYEVQVTRVRHEDIVQCHDVWMPHLRDNGVKSTWVSHAHRTRERSLCSVTR